jgi:hypothetical protein
LRWKRQPINTQSLAPDERHKAAPLEAATGIIAVSLLIGCGVGPFDIRRAGECRLSTERTVRRGRLHGS